MQAKATDNLKSLDFSKFISILRLHVHAVMAYLFANYGLDTIDMREGCQFLQKLSRFLDLQKDQIYCRQAWG